MTIHQSIRKILSSFTDVVDANSYADGFFSDYAISNDIANEIVSNLPKLKQPLLKTLEIANTSGNLTQKILNKYKDSCIFINATILVSSKEKFDICSAIFDKYIPKSPSHKINIIIGDFLEVDISNYHIILGTPEIKKVTGNEKAALSLIYDDKKANNKSIFALHKATQIGNLVCFIMPKAFLHNSEYSVCRRKISQIKIDQITDLGEKAYKSASFEFIALYLKPNEKPSQTLIKSTIDRTSRIKDQNNITDERFPTWLIYRNPSFNEFADKMRFDCFDVYRDRRITSSKLEPNGEVRVINSKNFPEPNVFITTEYDKYVKPESLGSCQTLNFLDSDDVFICPNMTLKTRVIKKPRGVVANGSLAILTPKVTLSDIDIDFYSSEEFHSFYYIVRNKSKRLLNLDKNAIYYFGILAD